MTEDNLKQLAQEITAPYRKALLHEFGIVVRFTPLTAERLEELVATTRPS